MEAEHDYAGVLGALAERLGLVRLRHAGRAGQLPRRRGAAPTARHAWTSWPPRTRGCAPGWRSCGGPPTPACRVWRCSCSGSGPSTCSAGCAASWRVRASSRSRPSTSPGTLARRVSAGVRGGNWGQGPWAVGGGEPVTYVVAYDLGRSLGEQALAANPLRVNDSKLAIRERLLSAHDDAERFNPLHSSDDPRQALDYLALLDDPGIVTRLRRRIAEIHEQMAFPVSARGGSAEHPAPGGHGRRAPPGARRVRLQAVLPRQPPVPGPGTACPHRVRRPAGGACAARVGPQLPAHAPVPGHRRAHPADAARHAARAAHSADVGRHGADWSGSCTSGGPTSSTSRPRTC